MKPTKYFTFLLLLVSSYVLAQSEVALVIIDMQAYFPNAYGNFQYTPEDSLADLHLKWHNNNIFNTLIEKQIEAINAAKATNSPIVVIEYDGITTTTNIQLMNAIGDYSNVASFKKTTNGIFDPLNEYRSDVVEYLDQKKIKHLVMVGANGGVCVLHSIAGGLALNKYSIYAYKDGIADFNTPAFTYPYPDYYDYSVSDTCSFAQFNDLNKLQQVFNIETKFDTDRSSAMELKLPSLPSMKPYNATKSVIEIK